MFRSPTLPLFLSLVAVCVVAMLGFGLTGCNSRQVTAPDPPPGDLVPDPDVPSGDMEPFDEDPDGSPAAPPDVILLHKYVKDAKDHSRLHHDGVLLGEPEFGPGCLDRALILDGVDDCVAVRFLPELQPAVVSVEIYFKPDQLLTDGTTFEPLVVKLASPFDFGNRVDGFDIAYQDPWGTGGRIGFGIGARSGRLRKVANAWIDISNDRFHHVVGTYDREFIRLYVDGELMASTPHQARIAYLDGPIFIGGGIEHHLILPAGVPQFFQGQIDEVVIYNRVLTPREIRRRSERCDAEDGAA